jgi:hypothetical protein
MLQLLYPLGLLAAVGITIPVLIHLWNVKPGKTLKIGSVILFGTPFNQRSRSLKLHDWPLLLLRCLLILLIAFLLAKPVYQQPLKSSEHPGWVLVKKADFRKLWIEQQPLLDSLIKKGYEVHDFDLGFKPIDLKDSLTSFSKADNDIPYFSLIRQLTAELPQGTRLYVFADNKLADFEGQKPATHLNLQWNIFQADSNKKSWPALAYEMKSGRVRQLTGKNTALGNYYVAEENGRPHEDIKVDTSTVRIQLYADKGTPDAAYVSSAILAAADFTRRKIVLQRIYGAAQVRARADLVFWLSEKKLTGTEEGYLSKPKVLFTYAGGKLQKKRSVMVDLSGMSAEGVKLHQRIPLLSDTLAPVWVDGEGISLLSKTGTKGSVHYKFYSRFRPEWTDLVWSEQMMSFLLPVILPASTADSGFLDKGKLAVGPEEMAIENVSNAPEKTALKYKETSFAPWLWWILILMFFMERWISYRNNTITS